MAKIRVYELARDLNLKNKALLEKLSDLNISVRSHMSSLDDEDVAKIKAAIFSKKEAAVEEMRVKPTVIRRRKKRKVVEEPAVEEAIVEEEAQLEDTETAEPLSETAIQEEPVQEALETEVEDVEPSVEADAAGEAQAIEEIATAEIAEEELEAPSEPPLEPQPTAAEEQEPAPALTAEQAESAAETQQTLESVEPLAALETDETADTAESGEQAVSAEAVTPVIKRIKPKKGKKEAAAKIIKLPVKPKEPKTEKPPLKKKAEGPRDAAAQLEQVDLDLKPPEEAPAAEIKKKKGKKRPEEIETDVKVLKKKTAFRRREIVEGADLYASGIKRGRKARKGAKAIVAKGQKTQLTTPKAIKRRIKIDDAIVLSDLAKRMGIKAGEMIAKLMGLGVMATVNQTIDFDTAVLVAGEFDYELERASFEEETVIKVETDEPDQLAERPPVVTIMGHVDHGKTSLLDVIRKTRITEIEAGGITQHIGAYHVTTDNGQIVFLDTPGHEAFTAMRARGAQVTDLVVLVVAADDGVMPQTVEAINHSKAAGVPIIVAVNKIDKANADPDRVQRELADLGLVPEDWGGDTIFVKVSAKQNQGIEELLEMILLQSEVLELKANPNKHARGHVIEARLDSGRGPVATVLVLEGTLQTGSPIVCGVHHGKVRAMLNDLGVQVDSAGPSIPVAVLGLTGVPMAGDEMIALDDEKDAKQISMHRLQKQRSKDLAKTSRLSLDKLYEQMQEGEVKDLNIILKADVHGSIEALRDSLVKLSNEEVRINVIHAATGTVTESDVSLAAVSDAIIIGFNVRPSVKVQELAAEENVDMRFYNIIYNVIQEVKDAIVGMMSSTFEERILGRADVREVFHVPKVGAIAGCYVTDGKIERGQLIRVIRDGVVTYDGKIGSLRRFKDDVKEVQSGYECGIGIERFNDIKVGDSLECYYLEEIKPELQ